MMSVSDLKQWLETLDPKSSVGVDEGGLTLIEVNESGKRTDAYLEIGGIPESEEA